MDTFIGLIMIGLWIWSIVILARKVENLTTLDVIVITLSVAGIGLTVLGALGGN